MADTLRVEAGRTFEVVLKAAGGTGYSWTMVPSLTADIKAVNPTRLRVELPDATPGAMPQVRGGLTYRFEFSADFAGEVELEFVLTRPWQADFPWEAPAAATHRVKVTVVPQIQRGGVDREVA